MKRCLLIVMCLLVSGCDNTPEWQKGKSEHEIRIRKEYGAALYDTCMYMMTLFSQTGVGVHHKEYCLCISEYSMAKATLNEIDEQYRTKAFTGHKNASEYCKNRK